jgi:hypothetical protein
MNTRIITAILLVILAAGCKQPAEQEVTVSAGPLTTSTAIERIVFVGMSDPCDCTRKKIETAQAALEAVDGAKTIHVDRFNLETDDEKIDVYRDKKPFMVVPALYFVDDAGNVLALLQGDITAKQVEDVIAGAQ